MTEDSVRRRMCVCVCVCVTVTVSYTYRRNGENTVNQLKWEKKKKRDPLNDT